MKDMESFLDAPLDRKTPTLFTGFFFFYISQKNSTKAKEISDSWLTVFSETPKNTNILLHFPTALHKKRNMFSVKPQQAVFYSLNSTVSQVIKNLY